MNRNPFLAIVILNFNGVKLLEQFLPSVVQTAYQNSKIYIIDNGSTDSSIAYLSEHYPEIEIIALEQNNGFAKGYNLGMKQIQEPYSVLLNSDVEVSPNWVEPILEMFKNDDNLGAVQPKIRSFHEKEKFEYAGAAGGLIDWLGYPFCKGRVIDSVEFDHHQYDVNEPIFWGSGCALFVRTELFRTLGFDNDYFMHQEEIDFCWRILNRGFSIKNCHSSIVYHVGGGSLQYGSPSKTFYNFRNSLLSIVKNDTSNFYLLKVLLRLILDGFAGLKLLIDGEWKHIISIIKAHFSFYSLFFSFLRKRRKEQKLWTTLNSKQFISKKLIVWEYFIKGNKKASDLLD